MLRVMSIIGARKSVGILCRKLTHFQSVYMTYLVAAGAFAVAPRSLYVGISVGISGFDISVLNTCTYFRMPTGACRC